jgi:hypothetical protein
MKLLSKLVCTTVILTPLVLSGCHSLFGDSTSYTYPQPYGHAHGTRAHHGPHGAMGPTTQTSKATAKVVTTSSTKVVKKRATSGVPLEAPVHNAAHSASTDNSAGAAASTNNANSSNAANNTVVVPSAGPATGLVAPTAQ